MRYYPKEILIGILFVLVTYFFATSVSMDHDLKVIRLEMKTLREDIRASNSNTINYLENRINRLAQSQDEYQVSSSSRMNVLENKLGLSITDSRNTNTNVNTIILKQ